MNNWCTPKTRARLVHECAACFFFLSSVLLCADTVRADAYEVPAEGLVSSEEGTLEFWFLAKEDLFSQYMVSDEAPKYISWFTVLEVDSSNPYTPGFLGMLAHSRKNIRGETSFRFRIAVPTSTRESYLGPVNQLKPGTWNHIAVTWSRYNTGYWLNGKLIDEHTRNGDNLLRFGEGDTIKILPETKNGLFAVEGIRLSWIERAPDQLAIDVAPAFDKFTTLMVEMDENEGQLIVSTARVGYELLQFNLNNKHDISAGKWGNALHFGQPYLSNNE